MKALKIPHGDGALVAAAKVIGAAGAGTGSAGVAGKRKRREALLPENV